MRLLFKGSYTDDDKLPHEEIRKHPDAVQFKEFENTEHFLLKINIVSFTMLAITMGIFHLLAGITHISVTGVLMIFVSMIPHECIHAMFFKRRVYLYLHKFALIITGTEPMTKSRFIAMTVMPSVIFGFIPMILFVINPELTILGTFGAISLPMCLGDFYNVYNCMQQVPNNGYCFMNKQNTYWFTENKQQTKRMHLTAIDKCFTVVSIVSIAMLYYCGLRNVECIGTILQTILYQMTAYSLIGLLQLTEPDA